MQHSQCQIIEDRFTFGKSLLVKYAKMLEIACPNYSERGEKKGFDKLAIIILIKN